MAATHHKTAEELIASVASQCRPAATASKAYAAHVAYKADIARIGRQQAEAIKAAPGYSAALGCIYSPKDTVAFINAQVEADRPALKMAAE